jgi:hypothetical protein
VIWAIRRAWRRWRYHLYLQSSTWWRIRMAVMIRDHFWCRHCNAATARQVHHLTYAHIFHEAAHLGDLIAVCIRCHAILTKEQGYDRHSQRAY